jgi:hypothetical protein
MMRFVTGQYAAFLTQVGMIGYVLNGKCDDAIRQVTKNILKQRANLKVAGSTGLEESSLRPHIRFIRETQHLLSRSRNFRLHHIFLACASNG